MSGSAPERGSVIRYAYLGADESARGQEEGRKDRRIGLDDAPSWIVTTEANAFIWPGPDIRPVPGRTPTTMVYGRVPDALLRQVARSYLANREKQRSRLISRTE